MNSDKIKVQLLQRIAGMGKQGDIILVSHSQAKNYLVPKGLAHIVTFEMEKIIQDKILYQKKLHKNQILNRHQIEEVLHGKELIFETKGSKNKTFGSIQQQDIVDKIKKDFGINLDKKVVLLPEEHHIKKAGLYDIKIDLGSDVYIKMSVEVKIL